MSHFTTVKTQVKDPECLVLALLELGFTRDKIHVSEKPVMLRTYTGSNSQNKAHVILKREDMGESCSDIGWLVDPAGEASEFFGDQYCNRKLKELGLNVQSFSNKVAQEYAAAKIIKKAKANRQAYKKVNENGRIKVLVDC